MSNMSRTNRPVVFVEPKRKKDDPVYETNTLPGLPSELVNEIGCLLDNPEDLSNLRLVNKRLSLDLRPALFKVIANRMMTIYPRYDSFSVFVSLLSANAVLPRYVRKIILVMEGLRVHKYGYEWAWEQLANSEYIDFTNEDMDIINTVNQSHFNDIEVNGAFLTGGGYRAMLVKMLRLLPNLKCIEIRPLGPNEHNPGWHGPELLEGLSFYHDKLNIKDIFYGDWKYDVKHLRVTVYEDEYGEEVAEPNAGPQADFYDDVVAAMTVSGTAAKITF